MKKRRSRLDIIDRTLKRAVGILHDAAVEIRDAKFDPQGNIRHIGEALVSIFAIQDEIYRMRPDLLPKYLADTKFSREVLSNRRFDRTVRRPGRKAGRRRASRSTAER